MKNNKLESFEKALLRRLRELADEETINELAAGTVQLDQQSVGRLSRMDALQQQAMAKALTARRNIERQAIAEALTRISRNEYGECVDCGEEIDERRLKIKPTVRKCLECARI